MPTNDTDIATNMTIQDFRERREGLGLSQKQLSILWNYGKNRVNRMEKGDSPLRTADVFALMYLSDNPRIVERFHDWYEGDRAEPFKVVAAGQLV